MRPMLAGPFVQKLIRYPVLVQPKLDGIRAVHLDGCLWSRNERKIPNQFIQFICSQYRLDFFDGELMVGDPTAEDAYRRTDSGVMSQHGEPDFTYMVFDLLTDGTYDERRRTLSNRIKTLDSSRFKLVEQTWVENEDTLLRVEGGYVEKGYEGVILRDPEGTYKAGRSTSREGKLIKLKRFEDAEACVVGFEELYSNQNPKTVGAHGLTERTNHAANMVPMDTLGALKVRDVKSGAEFRIGSFKGLTLEDRRAIWQYQDLYLGKILTYKYQKVGGYDLPRFPIFKGWRSDL
jgi:DNA ligase-1